jgi:hypothetical protein
MIEYIMNLDQNIKKMKKSETIIFKLSKEDKQKLLELSENKRLSLSSYIRMILFHQ